MARAASIATEYVVQLLRGENGVDRELAELAEITGLELAPVAGQVAAQNVSGEVSERKVGGTSPVVQVYCERVKNELREKFRTFSGKLRMVIEARVTEDRLEGLEQKIEAHVDAITAVLEKARGAWGQGMYHTGGYEVIYQPVKHGGRNFVQSAKVIFDVDMSSD